MDRHSSRGRTLFATATHDCSQHALATSPFAPEPPPSFHLLLRLVGVSEVAFAADAVARAVAAAVAEMGGAAAASAAAGVATET